MPLPVFNPSMRPSPVYSPPTSAHPAGWAAKPGGVTSALQKPRWACPGERGLHLPEEAKEPVGFQAHAQEGPAQEHNDHTPQEEAGPFELVLLEEEGKRLSEADDEGEASQEQQLREREEHEIKHTSPGSPGPGLGPCVSHGQRVLTLQGGTIPEGEPTACKIPEP